MIETQLNEAVYADATTRERLIRELAARSDEILPEVIQVIKGGPKRYWKIAAQVIHEIGYPKNAVAIPALLKLVADANAPGRNEAIEAVSAMDLEIIIPYLLQILWDRGRTNPDWVDAMAGICMMLKSMERSFALGCGPVIVYLLSQEIDFEDYDPIYLLRVLEVIGPDEAYYALPCLIDFVGKEAIPQDLRVEALKLIASFPQEYLKPYAQILPSLQKVQEE